MKYNLKKSIGTRITAGYLLIILLALFSTIMGVVILNKNNQLDKEVNIGYLPVSLLIKDFSGLSLESKRLVNNWVYQPNKKDKNQLIILTDSLYPEFKLQLLNAIGKIESQSLNDSTKALISTFEDLIVKQRSIMQKLSADSLYSNDIVVDECISILETNILPQMILFEKMLNSTQIIHNKELKEIQEVKKSSSRWLTVLFVGTTILYLIISLIFSFYSTSSIVKPLIALKDIMDELARGKITNFNMLSTKDELGQMSNSIQKMTLGLIKKSEFASQIGEGKYETPFETLSDDDSLGEAIIKMRDNLKASAEIEKNRSWANLGVAQMADILRNHQNDGDLYNQLLSFIVKYLKANQGGLFIVEQRNESEPVIQLKACYAYDRKKFMEKEIAIGDGLIGQCYLEKQSIFLTECPEDYVYIGSGTGGANPRCIVIVPLKTNDQVYGILELASFSVLESYQIEFLEKITETMASGIMNLMVNEKTKLLLKESIEQSEALKSQEEEMRQNLEEMVATQEEMARKEKQLHQSLSEIQAKEAKMKLLISKHNDEVEALKKQITMLEKKVSTSSAGI